MKLNSLMKESAYLEHTWHELNKGITVNSHPFRFCTLATSIDKNELKQRTLVLRSITEDKTLVFYTDFRSDKVAQILRNAAGSLLFYHPQKGLQLSLKGKVTILTNGLVWEKHIKNIDQTAKDDYNTLNAPGTVLENPEKLERNSKLNFCVLEFEISTIDYLQLNRDQDHIRLIFNNTANKWKGNFVVP